MKTNNLPTIRDLKILYTTIYDKKTRLDIKKGFVELVNLKELLLAHEQMAKDKREKEKGIYDYKYWSGYLDCIKALRGK